MSKNEIEQEVIELVIHSCIQNGGRECSGSINGNHRLKEDLHMDSVMLIILQVEVEDTYKIRFRPLDDDYISIFNTINSLSDYIISRLEDNTTW